MKGNKKKKTFAEGTITYWIAADLIHLLTRAPDEVAVATRRRLTFDIRKFLQSKGEAVSSLWGPAVSV